MKTEDPVSERLSSIECMALYHVFWWLSCSKLTEPVFSLQRPSEFFSIIALHQPLTS